VPSMQIRVDRLDEDFLLKSSIHKQALPSGGFPVVTSSREGVLLPILDYLIWCRVFNRNKIGTLNDKVYIMRDWFQHLHRRGRNWTTVDNGLLEDWRGFQETVYSRNGVGHKIGPKRIQTKLNFVFHFYRVMKEERYAKAAPPWNITQRLSQNQKKKDSKKKKEPGPEVRYSTIPQSVRSRPTPSDEQTQTVLDQIISGANPDVAATHWMEARWMYICGLRACGVFSVTTSKLEAALEDEGIHVPVNDAGRRSLASVKENWDARDEIVAALHRLKHTGREEVFVLVTEKYDKERLVGVPIDFFIENLNFIWEHRAAIVELKLRTTPGYIEPDDMWLSWQTGAALKRGSISWAIHRAFKFTATPGSPHRLRARYCETVVLDELRRQRALYGVNWEPQSVLFLAAQRMGHANLESLRPYLRRLLQTPGFSKESFVVLDDRRTAGDVRLLVKLLKNPETHSAFKSFLASEAQRTAA
jgi:hypothetical protein